LYGALVLGDVELVGDQYLSAAFSEAARFLSHQPFKDSLMHQTRPMVLAMSALFYSEWREDVRRQNAFPDTPTLQWTPFTCRDKHGYRHEGYVLGPGWTEETAVPSDLAEVEAGAESAEPVIPPAISLAVVSTGAAQETIQYTGQSKVNLCRELVSDWQDLADYFAIPPFTRARFDRGREPQGVWEWLETRRRLSELPGALVFIGRDELLEVLQTRPR